MKKLAIIGASYLQTPLILKAKEMGVETHVFAWQVGDIGERTADYFYPISIVDKERILQECRSIGIDGITTIASDLATVAVGYVADAMGLVGNSLDCVSKSTDKKLMRRAFFENGDPSPRSIAVNENTEFSSLDLSFPVIVKPSDRSGSRGITKLQSFSGIEDAVARAVDESFSKIALIEEFAEGNEYSVECISWEGRHQFITITEKFTTGAPCFIEMGHLEPARLSSETVDAVRSVVFHALDSLGITYGASHSEIKIDAQGMINIIEIGARMGGDRIGSDLVRLSTGYDFTKAVVDVALGNAPEPVDRSKTNVAAIRYIFNEGDVRILDRLKKEHPEYLIEQSEILPFDHDVVDSGSRFGNFMFSAPSLEDVIDYLPTHEQEEIA